MKIIEEFISALSAEIDSLKKGKGDSVVTIYNGELIRSVVDFFIYQFTLENVLITLDDTPATIEVNGMEYECDIISVSGQKVQISTKYKLSNRIPVAKIKTNTWYLLERLKNKYEENISNELLFNNSNKLFKDLNSKIDGGNFHTSYSVNGEDKTNASQHKAIESSINDFISVIWGPPGTGKTLTIAKAIECHLNLNRKVLLLSHSNNAVDQALIKVASQMKETYYKKGQLVRLGTPKSEMLNEYEKKDCALVLIEKIAEYKSRDLINEKDELNRKLKILSETRRIFKNILLLSDQLKEIDSNIEKNYSEYENVKAIIDTTKLKLSELHERLTKLREDLIKANNSGILVRAVLRLNPEKIKESIESINQNILLLGNQLHNYEKQLSQIVLEIQRYTDEKKKIKDDLSDQLSRVNKTIYDVQNELSSINTKEEQIQNRINEINNIIESIKIKILSDAKLVATTLTKSYIAKEIEKIDFDILIVDEVSMAPMPMLFWAASKIQKGITIVGDFKQLPPICVSDDDSAKKWLGRSIFDELGISDIGKAKKRPVQLLNTQYRMHPHISGLVRENIYEGELTDGEKVKNNYNKYDKISNESALCLVDTSPHNPWCSQFETGGRFNLISALICVSLVEKILSNFDNNESIGIVTPYRNQARLIRRIAEDRGISENIKIRINTIHSYQGGEETAIIFDSVEGEGAKKWSMLNEYNYDRAKLILNVALTRAEKKFYLVTNLDYIKNVFKNDTFFMNIIRQMMSSGKVIKSTEIFSDLRDENFDYWIYKLNSLKNRPENLGLGYDELDFWPAFHNDLAKIKDELIIFSPFLTSERFGKLHLIFTELIAKGIKIYIITLPPNEQPHIMQGAKNVILKLKEMGATVKFRHSMHEKIALIDREIKWIGSLNILSHNTRKEYMERFKGENLAKEIFTKFDLEDLLINPNLNGEFCPLCRSNNKINFIVPKFSQKNKQMFYGCSGYPVCKFTKSANSNSYGPKRQKNKKSSSSSGSSNDDNSDLFVNTVKGKQWETPICYWSSVKLPGYIYSKKKNAWWKRKPNK